LFSQTDSDSVIVSTPSINVFSNRIITLREDSPSYVQVFDKEFISKVNGNQVSDVLKFAGNVFIKSYGGNSSLKTISINGLSAEHTLILLNGVRLNSSQNAQYDLSLLSKESIESIEVMPSGGSVSYGSDAISGVVNIKTSSPENNLSLKKLNVSVTAEKGSYSFSKYDVSISGRMNNSYLSALYYNERSDDAFEYYFFNGSIKEKKTRQNNSYSKDNVNLQYSFAGKNLQLSLLTYYNVSDRSLPGVETGSDPSVAKQLDKNWNTILNFEYKSGYTFNFTANYQNNLSNYSVDPYQNNYYKNLVGALNPSFQLNYQSAKFLLGADLSYASIKSDQIDGFRERVSSAVYASNETNVLKNLTLFPSLRAENISDLNKQVIISKFGVNYKPLNNNILVLHTNIGNSFRSPTFNELYWKTGGNINLLPEKSLSFETGILSEFGFIAGNSIEVNYSYINSIDKIIWKPGNTIYWSPLNVGNSVSNILSVSLNSIAMLSDFMTIKLNANYSMNSSVKNNIDFSGDLTYNKQLIYIPKDLFKFSADVVYKSSGIGIYNIILGKRYTDFENTTYLNPSFLLDGNIYTGLSINNITTVIKFEVNNITNENYQVISGYPMPLRNYKIVLTLKY
jgi:iron complex outermembrane receptor protein